MQEAHESSETTELDDAAAGGGPEADAWPPPDPATGEMTSPAIEALSEQVEALSRHTQDSVGEIAGRLDAQVEAQEKRTSGIEFSLAKLSNTVEAIQIDIQRLLEASSQGSPQPTPQATAGASSVPERRPEHIERMIEKIWDEDPPAAE